MQKAHKYQNADFERNETYSLSFCCRILLRCARHILCLQIVEMLLALLIASYTPRLLTEILRKFQLRAPLAKANIAPFFADNH